MEAKRIHITGIVQGVGFRPFVYGLATRFDLRGWVNNTSAGVEIHVEGSKDQVEGFIDALSAEKPPLAKIDSIQVTETDPSNFPTFTIEHSTKLEGAFQPISPDVGICADCARELFDPSDRRYLYPFINCTNCGPRFTIIRDIPYDRPATTMSDFALCDDCRAEYQNPLDRRFHAQPVACPECGPHTWLVSSSAAMTVNRAAILETRRMLREGQIVAVKGLGGFHLACDALNATAVEELRCRKGRAGKPFALMAADLATIEQFCFVDEAERDLLLGHEKPIVLLERRPGVTLPESIAPKLATVGMMLPYTPLHLLLLNGSDPILAAEPAPALLVMTSGNFSEEPIATDNADALERLAPLADAFLLHNRDIHVRCDDSVVRVISDQSSVNSDPTDHRSLITGYLRRSRGYAPYPVNLSFATKPTLAVGGELKNTFCLTRDKYAFLSHHIGDMENAETYASFEQGIEHLSRLFRIQPAIIAHDMHPGYFTTSWVERSTLNVQRVPVQHHHAHIAACMADNGLDNRKVIGLAFDGTGYGTDGAIWGGEILLVDYAGFERFAHLEYLPLPGGDAAIKHPWRIAVGYAAALGLNIDDLPYMHNLDPQAVKIVRQQVEKKINTPLTSSMGRLFDAVAALANIRADVSYEAQAAIELEEASTDFETDKLIGTEKPANGTTGQPLVLPVSSLLQEAIQSIRDNQPIGQISYRFHHSIASMAVNTCVLARSQTSLNEVALSGGVWQNRLLLNLTRPMLEKEGFTVYFHKQLPTNDGGIALGQAVIANHVIAKERSD